MKNIGLLLLILGVSISAMYGARTTDTRRARLQVLGQASMVASEVAAKKKLYCETASKLYLEGLAKGCDPTTGNAHAKKEMVQTCARNRALRVTSLADGCRTDWLSTIDATAFGVVGHSPATTAIDDAVGVYRENTEIWTTTQEKDDRFVELHPSRAATFYSIDRETGHQVIVAQGTYERTGNQITTELCGVDRFVDAGCTSSTLRLANNGLQLQSVKLTNAPAARSRRLTSFAKLVITDSHKKKYEAQAKALGVIVDAQRRGRQQALGIPKDLQNSRSGWLQAFQASLALATAPKGLDAPQNAGARLGEWFGNYGIQFVFGLILIVCGGLMSRRAIRKSATEEPADGSGVAVDFGQMLGDLALSIAAHAEEMSTIAEPDDDQLERFKAFIDYTKVNSIEPIVESRLKLQIRYGIEGYAAVFGPLSRGERYMNRAWAALVDSHWPEGTASLKVSAEALADAHTELLKLVNANSASESNGS